MKIRRPCLDWQFHRPHTTHDNGSEYWCPGIDNQEASDNMKAISAVEKDAALAAATEEFMEETSPWDIGPGRQVLEADWSRDGMLRERMHEAAMTAEAHLRRAEELFANEPMADVIDIRAKLARGWSSYGQLVADILFAEPEVVDAAAEYDAQASLYFKSSEYFSFTEDGYERHQSQWVMTSEEERVPGYLPGTTYIRHEWRCDARWTDGAECNTSVQGTPMNEPAPIVCRRAMPAKVLGVGDIMWSDPNCNECRVGKCEGHQIAEPPPISAPVPKPHVESHQALWLEIPVESGKPRQWVCTRRWNKDRSQCEETITFDELVGDAAEPTNGEAHTRAIPTDEVELPEQGLPVQAPRPATMDEVNWDDLDSLLPDGRTVRQWRQMM